MMKKLLKGLVYLIFIPGPWLAPVFALSLVVAGVAWVAGYAEAQIYFVRGGLTYLVFGLCTAVFGFLSHYQGYVDRWSFKAFLRDTIDGGTMVGLAVFVEAVWPLMWFSFHRDYCARGSSLAAEVLRLGELPAQWRTAQARGGRWVEAGFRSRTIDDDHASLAPRPPPKPKSQRTNLSLAKRKLATARRMRKESR